MHAQVLLSNHTLELDWRPDQFVTTQDFVDAAMLKDDEALEALSPTDLPFSDIDAMIVNVMAEAPFKDNVTTGPLRDPASRDRVEFQTSMYDDAYQLLDEFAALCATTYAIVSKLGLSDQLLDKHTAVRTAWLRKMVKASLIDVRKIAATSNITDIFTKVLPPISYRKIHHVLVGSTGVASVICLFGT